MFERIFVISFILCALSFTSVECNAQRTLSASSANLVDVTAAVTLAATGDTVIVPAGTATWNGTLSLTKGIILKGAGIGNTNITSATTGFLINYQPSITNWTLNAPLRITGFTFNQANQTAGGAIKLDQAYGTSASANPTVVQSNIRIDHNRFLNSSNHTNQSIQNLGMRGVVDNNVFDNVSYPIRENLGFAQKWWDTWGPIKFGAPHDTMYFEDNSFTGLSYFLSDCQYGNRYSFRYNSITLTPTPGNESYHQMIDMHGNQPTSYSDMYSCFGGELYGNKVDGGNIGSIQFLDQRGGRVLGFNNYFINAPSVYIQLREEYDDSLHPTVNQPQHVTESYFWNNRYTGGTKSNVLLVPGTLAQPNGVTPTENIDFFLQRSDGSGGIASGNMLPAACTKNGSGFWVTNQSTTDLTGMIGVHPSTPIAGTLYKCTAPNTPSPWSVYYSPLEYPHPLAVRGPTSDGIVSGVPNAPTDLHVSN